MNKLFQILIFLFATTAVHAQTKTAAPKTTGTKSSSNLAASMERGKAVYAANCLACHQASGGGVPSLNPTLKKTKWVTGPKTDLIQWVLKGGKGHVEIDGESFHNAMPSQAKLSDDQIADVLTYVRNSFGNKNSAVTPAEVTAVRAKTK